MSPKRKAVLDRIKRFEELKKGAFIGPLFLRRVERVLGSRSEKVYPPRVGACRPSWRRASVRFSESMVVRNSILSGIHKDVGTERGKGFGLSDKRPVRDCRRQVPEASGSRLNR